MKKRRDKMNYLMNGPIWVAYTCLMAFLFGHVFWMLINNFWFMFLGVCIGLGIESLILDYFIKKGWTQKAY